MKKIEIVENLFLKLIHANMNQINNDCVFDSFALHTQTEQFIVFVLPFSTRHHHFHPQACERIENKQKKIQQKQTTLTIVFCTVNLCSRCVMSTIFDLLFNQIDGRIVDFHSVCPSSFIFFQFDTTLITNEMRNIASTRKTPYIPI